MKKIYFVSPYARKPTGGIKFIYELSKYLSSNFQSGVWSIDTIRNTAGSNYETQKINLSDKAHWIIPEFAVPYLVNTDEIKFKYSILVQNPYIIFLLKRFNKKNIIHNFNNAANIFCISKDTENIIKGVFKESKTIRLKWSLDNLILNKCNEIKSILNLKKNKILYMPRKCKEISSILDSYNFFQNWELKAIYGLSYEELINELISSKIFISLSEFEGFAAPPVEAYALGNLIIGYAGNGNSDLFNHKNFFQVEQNNFNELIYVIKNNLNNSFDLEDYYELISKFKERQVLDYNQKSFEKANLEKSCIINGYFKYPRKIISYYYDSLITKFYENIS